MPAAAMRTGHMSRAFFTPRPSASPTRLSWIIASLQEGRLASMPMAAESISLEESRVDLDFLLANRFTS